jgi:hypothetical protein
MATKSIQKKRLDAPDEVRTFDKGKSRIGRRGYGNVWPGGDSSLDGNGPNR